MQADRLDARRGALAGGRVERLEARDRVAGERERAHRAGPAALVLDERGRLGGRLASSSRRPAPSRQTVCAEAACMRRCGLRWRAEAAASRPAANASSKRPARARQTAAMTTDSAASTRSGIRRTSSSIRSAGRARLAEAAVGVAPAERLEPVREQLRGADPLGDLDRPLGGAARLRQLVAVQHEPADHRRAADQQRPDLERVALLGVAGQALRRSGRPPTRAIPAA